MGALPEVMKTGKAPSYAHRWLVWLASQKDEKSDVYIYYMIELSIGDSGPRGCLFAVVKQLMC